MNRKFKTFKVLAFSVVTFSGIFMSCVGDSNSPGLEYMPDMYRSPAVEPYYDNGQVLGKYNLDLVDAYQAGLPPAGTIPTSSSSENDLPYKHGAPVGFKKSHGLYGIAVDPMGYVNSATDINPIAYSENVKKEAKRLYGYFCIQCHGEKGDGQGSVVANGGFPTPPSYTGNLKDLPAGQIFYSMTYGKGLMGAHASQLTKEERWTIVHHVELLQGKEKSILTQEEDIPIVEVEKGSLVDHVESNDSHESPAEH